MRRSPDRCRLAAGLALFLAACTDEVPCGGPLLTSPGYTGAHCCAHQTACKVGPGVTFCIDLQADPDSCGACWVGCGTGTCVAGACQCPAPLWYCPPSHAPAEQTWAVVACVDVSSDPVNCGGCGVSCAGDEWCVRGACVRDDRCDGVTCRSTLVCGHLLPCEQCVKGACQDLAPHFRGCVPSCGVAAAECGLVLGCGITGGTCQPSSDCTTCCTGP
ncbi:MAG TPA: hypothetical protein VFM53_03965 [Anaeromyxobacteraceae bacterium]|nr:hypothetical protein [Anaeromyxobacteraceae bacterium]